jgi:hypothetical protein
MSVSNTSLPPKRQSSRRGLVLFAVLAGAGVGALAFMMSRSKAAPPPVPVALQEPAPVVKNIPPPPPPPPEPEVVEVPAVVPPPEAKLPAKPRAVPCSGECSGSKTAELEIALRGRAGQSRSCYERALSNNSALTGKLVVSVRVTPQGSVCSANVSQDSLGDPGVTRCIVQRFLSGTYPKPQGGCVDVAVPINFVPRQ